MKIMPIALILFFTAFAANGYCLEIFKTDKIFSERYDNMSIPTDVVFKNGGDFAVYDAFGGKIINYSKFKRNGITEDSEYHGGNCLVLISGDYYLCDSPDKRVLILDGKMKVKGEISIAGGFDPTDVVSNKNSMFIVDNDGHRIAVYDKKTKKITSFFGRRGGEMGEFNYPFSAATDNDGFIFVSEVINTRIQSVSPKLKGIMAIGKWGVKPGELYRPKGVAVVYDKYLVISDGYVGVLQVFDTRTGKFIGVLGDAKGKLLRYSSPTRIRSFGDRLAIVDPYDRLVEIIDLGALK